MSEEFKLRAQGLDLESLGDEVERRAGPGRDAPIARPVPAAAEDEPGQSAVVTLLRSLAEEADVSQGFPPQSHRPIGGGAVVAAKKGFRLAFQPLINDAFARQNLFNRRLLDTLAALHAENQALHARVAQLEAEARPGLEDAAEME